MFVFYFLALASSCSEIYFSQGVHREVTGSPSRLQTDLGKFLLLLGRISALHHLRHAHEVGVWRVDAPQACMWLVVPPSPEALSFPIA